MNAETRQHTHIHVSTYLGFFLKVLGWHLPGMSWGPSHFDTASVHYLRNGPAFFGFLLGLHYSCFCSFCQLFFDFSAASCKFSFSAKTILNLFAVFSSFLSSKLNFLPFAANLQGFSRVGSNLADRVGSGRVS